MILESIFVFVVGETELIGFTAEAGKLKCVLPRFAFILNHFDAALTRARPISYIWLADESDVVFGLIGIIISFVRRVSVNIREQNSESGEANERGNDARGFVFENAENENRDNRKTIDRREKVIWERFGKTASVRNASVDEKSGRSGEDETRIPLILFHEPSDKSGWESEESNLEPIGVIAEESPAHFVKRDLEEINERLRDQEKGEGFHGGFERFFAVHDHENREENPRFGRHGDVVEGISVGDENRHEGGIDAGENRENNHARPSHF